MGLARRLGCAGGCPGTKEGRRYQTKIMGRYWGTCCAVLPSKGLRGAKDESKGERKQFLTAPKGNQQKH